MSGAAAQHAFADWMRARLAAFEAAAAAQLPSAETQPQRLHAAMRYAVLDGGKRVRPLLAFAAAEAAGADGAAAMPVALAVEFIHAYSLIHDDLPCMDDDVLRRGKPTVHMAFDEATAMLAGDALQAESFRALTEAPLPDAVRAALCSELAVAIGSAGMCGGQALDLAAVGGELALPELETMHRMKTGALLAAAVRMGALAAQAPAALLAALDHYARAVGLAFQIVDDILDVQSSSAQLGKTAGKDAAQNKSTYVSLLGMDAARARAQALHNEALAPLGAGGRRLRELADLIVLRDH